MNALKSYTEFIEGELSKVDFPASPSELYDPLRYFLKLGGKRIRPILTILGSEMFGGSKETALSQALSIEAFHNFTLIHDDIMDEAPVRRGQATVHEKWNANIGISYSACCFKAIHSGKIYIHKYNIVFAISLYPLNSLKTILNRIQGHTNLAKTITDCFT